MLTLDALDQALLSALQDDARMSVSALAKRLGAARTTVQARLERLERRKIIVGYSVRLNPDAEQAFIRATVLAQIAPRATPSVLARLRNIPQVESAHTTSGRFDLALRLRAATTADLDDLLDEIGAMDGVRSLESLIHLSTRIDRAM